MSTSTRVCPTCDIEFEVRRSGGRPQQYCSRACKTKAANKNVTPDFKRSAQFKYKYGITLVERDAMRLAQNYRCAICNGHEEVVGVLRVDHDHATSAVRKMLCHNCNVALGFLQDDPEIVMKAAAYLIEMRRMI